MARRQASRSISCRRHAVDRDRSLRGLVEAGHEIDQGRLADARGADQRGHGTAADLDLELLQDRLAAIGERHPVEPDRLLQQGRHRPAMRLDRLGADPQQLAHRAVLVVGMDEAHRLPLHRQEGADDLDHQHRHDEQVVELEREPGDRHEQADGEHAADQRLLQVGRVLAAEHGAARHQLALAHLALEHGRQPARPAHRPDRLDAGQHVGELGGVAARLAALLAVDLAAAPHQAAEPHRRDQGDDQDDQQQLPRQQGGDEREQQDREHPGGEGGEALEALAGRGRLVPDRVRQPVDRLAHEIAPAGGEQAADQPDPHVAGDRGHDVLDVAADLDRDQRLEAEPDHDQGQDRQRLERDADGREQLVEGDDDAAGQFLEMGGGDDQRHHHGEAEQPQHAGQEGADAHQPARTRRGEPDHLGDRGRPLAEVTPPLGQPCAAHDRAQAASPAPAGTWHRRRLDGPRCRRRAPMTCRHGH